MKQETLDKLEKDYENKAWKKDSSHAIKYHFTYNGIHINVYYDHFDNDSNNCILIMIYGDQYYLSPLNVKSNKIKKQYLTKLPPIMFAPILDKNNQLDDFFFHIEQYILTHDPFYNISYQTDLLFKNTSKYNCEEPPFFQGVKRTNMTDTHKEKLYSLYDIPLHILDELQRQHKTLVRTANPARRKKLRLILQNENIDLD